MSVLVFTSIAGLWLRTSVLTWVVTQKRNYSSRTLMGHSLAHHQATFPSQSMNTMEIPVMASVTTAYPRRCRLSLEMARECQLMKFANILVSLHIVFALSGILFRFSIGNLHFSTFKDKVPTSHEWHFSNCYFEPLLILWFYVAMLINVVKTCPAVQSH